MARSVEQRHHSSGGLSRRDAIGLAAGTAAVGGLMLYQFRPHEAPRIEPPRYTGNSDPKSIATNIAEMERILSVTGGKEYSWRFPEMADTAAAYVESESGLQKGALRGAMHLVTSDQWEGLRGSNGLAHVDGICAADLSRRQMYINTAAQMPPQPFPPVGSTTADIMNFALRIAPQRIPEEYDETTDLYPPSYRTFTTGFAGMQEYPDGRIVYNRSRLALDFAANAQDTIGILGKLGIIEQVAGPVDKVATLATFHDEIVAPYFDGDSQRIVAMRRASQYEQFARAIGQKEGAYERQLVEAGNSVVERVFPSSIPLPQFITV